MSSNQGLQGCAVVLQQADITCSCRQGNLCLYPICIGIMSSLRHGRSYTHCGGGVDSKSNIDHIARVGLKIHVGRGHLEHGCATAGNSCSLSIVGIDDFAVMV